MSRRFLIRGSSSALIALCVAVFVSDAEAIQFGRRFHHWGRFRPGSWVVVRQGCETLGAGGQVVSNTTSETKTTLAGVDDKAMTLHVQASLEVGGKLLDAAPQQLREGLLGEKPEAATYVDLGEESVAVQGQNYRCQIQQTETNVGGRRQVTKTWFAPQVAPYVLRRLTTIVDASTGAVVSETEMQVTKLSVERRILARLRPVAEVAITQRHPRGQTRTQAFTCPDIPGGIVSQTSEEYDVAGNLLRRSKAELVDFETK